MIATITGKIVAVLPKRTGVSKNGNEWASQSYVIEDEAGDKIAFDVFGQSKIDEYNLSVGTKASATVKIESREWSGKWFTSANCTECISNSAPKETTPQQPVQQAPVAPPRVEHKAQDVSADELPF